MTPAEVLADQEEEMWRQAVAQFGDKYRLWQNWPRDVHQN